MDLQAKTYAAHSDPVKAQSVQNEINAELTELKSNVEEAGTAETDE